MTPMQFHLIHPHCCTLSIPASILADRVRIALQHFPDLSDTPVVAFPFINRAWERHKVAARIRHERGVRAEIKLDALLGLVNINDIEDRR